jgi:hypothetical protein
MVLNYKNPIFALKHNILMNDMNLYRITEEEVQCKAYSHIGRYLTSEELILFTDRLSDGIDANMPFIYNTLFDEFSK